MSYRPFHVNRACHAPSDAGGGGAPAGGTAVVIPAGAAAPAGVAAPGAAAPVAFADSLPESIRADAVFRDIKDLDGLAKSYHSAAKMIGGRPEDLMKLPGVDDAEAWSGVYAKLGRPEKADGYTFKPAEGAPAFTPADKAFQAAMMPAFHAAGMNQKQLDAVAAAYEGYAGKIMGETGAAAVTLRATNDATLHTEWGKAFDQNIGDARAAAVHYFGEETAKLLESDPKYGDSIGIVRGLATMGKQLREDGVVGRVGAGGGALSPVEAQQQIAGLLGDAQFSKAYTDKANPGHQAAVDKMAGLYAQGYPEPVAA
jgi:hypothetical protein